MSQPRCHPVGPSICAPVCRYARNIRHTDRPAQLDDGGGILCRTDDKTSEDTTGQINWLQGKRYFSERVYELSVARLSRVTWCLC